MSMPPSRPRLVAANNSRGLRFPSYAVLYCLTPMIGAALPQRWHRSGRVPMKVSRLIPGRRSRSSQGDVGDQAAARSEVGRLGAERHQSIGLAGGRPSTTCPTIRITSAFFTLNASGGSPGD